MDKLCQSGGGDGRTMQIFGKPSPILEVRLAVAQRPGVGDGVEFGVGFWHLGTQGYRD